MCAVVCCRGPRRVAPPGLTVTHRSSLAGIFLPCVYFGSVVLAARFIHCLFAAAVLPHLVNKTGLITFLIRLVIKHVC